MYRQHAHPEFYMYLPNEEIIIFHFSSQIPVVQRCMINCIRKLPIQKTIFCLQPGRGINEVLMPGVTS